MKFTEHLNSIYSQFSPETWVNQNSFVFYNAKKCGLALAGSIAISVGRKKAIKIPGDIDFVSPSLEKAMEFVGILQAKLFQYPSYWKVMINNRTAFCPPGCTTHIRVQTGFWLPICIMVIPTDTFHVWRTEGAQIIQKFDDVVLAAEALDERDEKGRITEEIKADKGEPIESIITPDDYLEEIGEFERLPHPWETFGIEGDRISTEEMKPTYK